MNKASKEMRVWFITFGVILWLGIYLTGFSVTHWLLYIPAIMLVVAGVLGICPSMILVSKLFKSK